jgi:signal transduction histidine kinase
MTLMVSLAAILVVLAVLQYQWSGQISKSEREQLSSSLRTSMEQFSQQLSNEFRQLKDSLQPDQTILMLKNWNGYAASCDSMLRASNHHLVSNIYLWVTERDNGSQLLKLNQNTKAFETASWPSNLETIRERYDRLFSNPAHPDLDFRSYMPNFSFRIPLIIQPLTTFQWTSPRAFQEAFQGTSQRRPSPPNRGNPSGGRQGSEIPGSGRQSSGMPGGGMSGSGMRGGGMQGNGMRGGGMPGGGMQDSGMQWVGFLLIELDRESLRNEFFPALAQNNFKDSIYQVAVIGGHNHDTFLYKSDPELKIESFSSADAKSGLRVGLMENRFGPMMQRQDRDMDSQGRGSAGPSGMQFRPDMQPSNGRGRRGSPTFFNDPSSGWELVAKHRVGSLAKAVAATRRRNLAFSFGSLLLLALSTAFIIASARRAQSLARLQIDFVAGISHELRTPLAVICSAGDNLADGVVAEASQSSRKYGELIRNEGRKLTGMIEQILQYAGGQKGRRRYNLRPEHLNDIADAALNQMQPAIVEAGFSVEKSFASGLPRIHVDATALSQAIQNLIQNALKYSGQSRWLAIRTLQVPNKRGADVLLTVEDKGMGIASADLPHLFEPFYRGSAATEAQIHGTGLGLYMVREALISMRGKISAKSTPGKGSIFTVTLPALPDSDNPAASEG